MKQSLRKSQLQSYENPRKKIGLSRVWDLCIYGLSRVWDLFIHNVYTHLAQDYPQPSRLCVHGLPQDLLCAGNPSFFRALLTEVRPHIVVVPEY